ncbi:hydrolase [Salmonella enterica subsp. enterica serovar Sanjuan]|uniref:Hydrolase n=1 Tax=Salmonella enterica subsp. enterica serovar Sanjuan TaxID=1160765 RepID=A0A447P018_SALET|nr:hydrolase [Salmonella enterica subsp. enterica serovar Sanjuan]
MSQAATGLAPMATGYMYRGDSRIINPQGDIIATAEPHQATRIDADLSLVALQDYRENFQPGAMPIHSPCKQPAAHRGGIVSFRNSP